MAEVSTIFHFFGKDVGGIDSAFNMGDGDGRILEPFADNVLTILHMAGRFVSHVVKPFDTGLVVIVKGSVCVSWFLDSKG